MLNIFIEPHATLNFKNFKLQSKILVLINIYNSKQLAQKNIINIFIDLKKLHCTV